MVQYIVMLSFVGKNTILYFHRRKSQSDVLIIDKIRNKQTEDNC